MEVRHPADHDITGTEPRGRPYLLQIGQHRTVGHLHPLGAPVLPEENCRNATSSGPETAGSRSTGPDAAHRGPGHVHHRAIQPPPTRSPHPRRQAVGPGAPRSAEHAGRREPAVRGRARRRARPRTSAGSPRCDRPAAAHRSPARCRPPAAPGHVQRVVQEFAEGDGQLVAVAAYMDDDLPGSLPNRAQQYIQQCHVGVVHRSVGPFSTRADTHALIVAPAGRRSPLMILKTPRRQRINRREETACALRLTPARRGRQEDAAQALRRGRRGRRGEAQGEERRGEGDKRGEGTEEAGEPAPTPDQ